MWSDIDYMDAYKDFTYDKVNFANLSSFVDGLHDKNMQYIPIIDAGVAMKTGYKTYDDGVSGKNFIMTENGEVLAGSVWPDDAAFPDFFANGTTEWWKSNLDDFHSQIKFDGLWEDMNEASNFCDGVCYPSQMAKHPNKYKLSYVPTGRDLETKSLSLDGVHANNYTELDTHSLFGTMEVKATHEWFKDNNMRTMIIERSAYAGMGKFASRWLGDNFAQDAYMGYSVTGIMSHNIMGIPLAGSDICGFIGDTNPELCARWHTLGAFYPFSRNHNGWDDISQEPYVDMFNNAAYVGTTTYTAIMRNAI